MDTIYTLNKPENPLPLVFDSPHSGAIYPDDFDYACSFDLLEKAEDKYVDDLFAAAPDYGAALLCALFPRSYIDANRCEKDIDHELLEDLWMEESNPTARSHAGIGLIRRLIRPGVRLYGRPLRVDEIKHRIETYYRPYHSALEQLITEAHRNYGQVWHINCHSMPAQSAYAGQRGLFASKSFRTPDIVLGDRNGTTCDLDFTHSICDFFRNLGYKVAINDPYKGVELVRRYSDPVRGIHSLQIEICKSLYMDEETGQRTKNYDALKSDLEKFTAFCINYAKQNLIPLAAD